MTQVDTSIYGNMLRPVKSVQEYDAEAQQAEGNKLGLLLQRGQYDAQQRGVADDAAYRDAVRGFGADSGVNANMLRARGLGKQAMDYEKSALDAVKTAAEVANLKKTGAKTDSDLMDASLKRYRAGLDFIETPQGAVKWLQAQYQDPALSALMNSRGPFEEAIKHIPQTPAEFNQWRDKVAMGIENYSKKLQEDRKIAETEFDHKEHRRIAAGQLGVAQGNLSLSRQRLTMDQNAPKGQIVQTDQGTMLVDPRGATATPVIGPGGVALTKPLKDIPANVNTAIITNSQNLNKVNQAIDLLSGKDVGALKGDKDATGWKGYAPQAILNRSDPKGVDTRAMISDIGSLILHDRSGAAITASESPRLMPFIPLATDDNPTAIKKLTRFKQLYEQEQQAFADTYSKDQGYRPSPTKSAGGAPSKTANGATVSNW